MSLSLHTLGVIAFSSIIALVSGCTPARNPGKGGSGSAEVGKLAPAMTIQPLNAKSEVSLNSLTGKVAIVDFWATWCEPCKKSMPQLEKIAKQSGGKVEVVGISVDDTRSDVAAFAKAQGASFPIGWDENHTLMRRWSVEKMPTTYILDGTGTVRFMHKAYSDDGDAIEREVAQLTSEAAAAKPATEVASAPAPEATPAAAPTAPPVTAAASAPVEEPTPEPVAAPTAKPKGKPATSKKAAPKKKKTSAAAGKPGV